jgi:UDP-glucose-4-epimerase GalE
MAVLVTGGAGYIGSITVETMTAGGADVVVVDNLSRGHRDAVDPAIPFYQADVGDRETIAGIVRRHAVDACVHFAALAAVGESVRRPDLYYGNNVGQGEALLTTLAANGVKKFVFSSTCATYGEPVRTPIGEDHPQNPANPYGWSKLIFEKMLAHYDAAFGLKSVSLRYFNAAGATASRGERHEPETHLIPNILDAVTGRKPALEIFGSDYPTPDGTAIRDYIHVADLAEAHVLALRHLEEGGGSLELNLGTGTGHSILEVIRTVESVTGREVPRRFAPRRPGDAAVLVADASRAKSALGWTPRYPGLAEIVETAWAWHRKLYGAAS